MNTNTGEYREILYESEAELWFLFWAFELYDKKIIDSIERAPTFPLTEGLDREFVITDTKGREVTKRQTILRPSEYTPEFIIIWNLDKSRKFVTSMTSPRNKIETPFIGTYILEDSRPLIQTYVEIKPSWDQNSMTRLFKNNQKFLWDKLKVFVNLIKIPDLFEKTFCPSLWLKTKTGKDRKVNFEVRTLEQILR